MKKPLKVGVLISGSGTNLQEIINQIAKGKLNAEIVTVISSRSDVLGLIRAQKAGIPTCHIDQKKYETASQFNQAIAAELLRHGTQLVVLAGYMKLLGTEVLEAFPGRVINLHPALLPSFKGAHGIEDAFNYGVKVSGVTVHFVDATYDTGAIIAQLPVPISEDDTLETFEARIHQAEYRLLPGVIQLFAEDRVHLKDGRVHIEPPFVIS